VARSDPDSPNMGLTTWKGTRVRKGDVATAKNYLTSSELSELNLLTTRFLDFAEDRARRRRQITMAEWVAQTDRFLDFDERRILTGRGTVSADNADRVTTERYAAFDRQRRTTEAERADLDDLNELRELERETTDQGEEANGSGTPE